MTSIREQFAGDRHRPVYHFVPPKNWTNDPTGTFQANGLFHLFYQYRDAPSPEGPGGWGTWCHAATEDFIHWIDYPVAIEREEGGPDHVGCWSGGAFERDGSHTLIYWGNPGGICLADSDDGYRTWRKHPRNPVIELPDEPVEWRLHDPCAWKDGEWFYMASGSQIGKPRAIGSSRDAGFLFRSRDAVDWEYAGLLYEPGGESDLAVPSFFPFGDGHMLLFASHSRGAQ
ncbi:MAG: glycoside hydrolase family 32 protein, partial [Gemmatimonadetes bacterium]|nr:glycoside hydrolase family 32 protein [Gemmatimonadota bacterium]